MLWQGKALHRFRANNSADAAYEKRAIGILTGRIDGNGIGAFISDANTAGSINPALAAALWAGILGLALNALLLWAERRVLPWHHAYLEESEAAQ